MSYYFQEHQDKIKGMNEYRIELSSGFGVNTKRRVTILSYSAAVDIPCTTCNDHSTISIQWYIQQLLVVLCGRRPTCPDFRLSQLCPSRIS